MDKLLHISGSGAREIMLAQANCAHNLSHVSTPGFKAAINAQRAMPLYGDGLPSRVYAGTEITGYDFSAGNIEHTGDPLNIAVMQDGWLAVQGEDGKEAYTRRGDLRVENGVLVNGAGNIILGNGGPINVPAAQSLSIGEDGAVNIVPVGNNNVVVTANKIKCINGKQNELTKREDGLFITKNGVIPEADPTIKVKSGVLETSNVNAVGEIINMINLAKNLELSIKITKNMEDNDRSSARLLQLD